MMTDKYKYIFIFSIIRLVFVLLLSLLISTSADISIYTFLSRTILPLKVQSTPAFAHTCHSFNFPIPNSVLFHHLRRAKSDFVMLTLGNNKMQIESGLILEHMLMLDV